MDLYLGEVKKPAESKYPGDFYRILSTVPGEKVFVSLADSECPLETSHEVLLRRQLPRTHAGNESAHAHPARDAGAAEGPCGGGVPQRYPLVGRRLCPGPGPHAVLERPRRVAAADDGP
ncbi:hypothetical protein G6F24_016883 [Rhizopus arrhizus]|nr:hypothetical protein G6F24_016883 [Rhizopus arrhizus]